MEGMKRPNVVSLLDWRNKVGDYSGLKEKNGEGDGEWERIGSGLSLVSACGGESDGDLKMLRESTHSPIYKDVVSQANGRWGAQIYEKHQRIWVSEDACDIAGLKFRGVFKPAEGGHLQSRFLNNHSKVETMDVIPKRQFEDHLDHSKITASTVPAQSQSHAPFGIVERMGEPVKLQQYKEVKRGEGVEKSESPWEKDKSFREPMFEKAVTPSDVGKLNRLVIPKHHAEKYFPLDTNANDKGLLLNFEDNTGKAWRFRYSYWNSSQSYVLTKGWSRFVKEKKLDAGDIVSFERSKDGQNTDRLFISWKRRPCALQIQPGSKASLLRRLSLPSLTAPSFQYGSFQSQALIRAASSSKAIPEWMSVVWPPNNGGALWRLPTEASSAHQPLPLSHNIHFLAAEEQNSVREPHDFMQLKSSELSTGDRSSPVENAAAMSSKKGVRLFGVNL